MANALERPLDLLNNSRGKKVVVELKDGNSFVGTLVAFDIHINLVIDEAQELKQGEIKRRLGTVMIRGDNIVLVSPGE